MTDEAEQEVARRMFPRKRSIIVIALLGLALIVSLFGGSASRASTDARWNWGTVIPGVPVGANNLTQTVARLGGVDVASIHQLITIGSERRFAVLAARGPSNTVCLSLGGSLFANAFHCLDNRVEEHAIIDYVVRGGSTPESYDYTTILGVLRNDVTRLSVTLDDGSQRDIALNHWRAFAFTANSPDPLPQTLTAYSSDGTALEQKVIGEGPLCGGAVGPCTGVR
jgi:hypothetical protein